MPEVIFRKRGSDWTLQSDEELEEGQEVEVSKKSGATTVRTVGQFIREEDGKFYYATGDRQASSGRPLPDPRLAALFRALTGNTNPKPDEVYDSLRGLMDEVYGSAEPPPVIDSGHDPTDIPF